MTEDLKIIKKKYGEQMMHLCREIFPNILEEPGLLAKLLLKHFDCSKSLYKDIIENDLVEDFKNYVYNFIDVEKHNKEIVTKTPEQLMQEAGYILYECHTEEEIQAFKKYYASGEELCTFRGGRLDRCVVFFAVKNNVGEIRRENFKNPTRQDEYGTSVISIQFTKDSSHTLSIKNRYNHTVNNPDATFSNNLDNIIEGLTESFEKYYGLKQENISNSFEIPGYVLANDGRYYKYNYEINNIYYCPNNIIIDNFEVKKYPKEEYVVLDYFIIDLRNKTIKLYDEGISDSFTEMFGEITKIKIENLEKEKKKIIITPKVGEDIVIEIDKLNNIVSLMNQNVKIIRDNFLYFNRKLTTLNTPNLQVVGDNLLLLNEGLFSLNVPNLQKVGNNFLLSNIRLTTLKVPNLKETGHSFLHSNEVLDTLDAPNLQKTGCRFLNYNRALTTLNLPNLLEVGDDFLYSNEVLTIFYVPNLQKIGGSFLNNNKALTTLNLPNLQETGNAFLYSNEVLNTLYAPNLRKTGIFFLGNNKELTTLDVPDLLKELLQSNKNIKL